MPRSVVLAATLARQRATHTTDMGHGVRRLPPYVVSVPCKHQRSLTRGVCACDAQAAIAASSALGCSLFCCGDSDAGTSYAGHSSSGAAPALSAAEAAEIDLAAAKFRAVVGAEHVSLAQDDLTAHGNDNYSYHTGTRYTEFVLCCVGVRPGHKALPPTVWLPYAPAQSPFGGVPPDHGAGVQAPGLLQRSQPAGECCVCGGEGGGLAGAK